MRCLKCFEKSIGRPKRRRSNMAGPRESKKPGVYKWALAMLHLLIIQRILTRVRQ
jgi:hypothetical protein